MKKVKVEKTEDKYPSLKDYKKIVLVGLGATAMAMSSCVQGRHPMPKEPEEQLGGRIMIPKEPKIMGEIVAPKGPIIKNKIEIPKETVGEPVFMGMIVAPKIEEDLEIKEKEE